MQADYRPEIDGLRAVAVLSVLLYHVGFSFIPGGFIGVDVFLVISGYLITRLLVREIEQTGDIRFTHFYARRIRRIVPALVATSIGSLIAGFLLFTPEMLTRLAQSAIAAILSASNILFWRQSGYFDATNVTKPLLHTWSLGIEEQFYLLWPPLLLVAAKIRISSLWIVAATIIVSLTLSILFLSQQATIYYLLPFRAFELGVGAALVWLERHRLPALARVAMLPLGLGLIVASALIFTPKTIFPSYNALWPCLGAAMIIYAGPVGVSALLTNPPTIGLGLISYSLYLVHWPIIVFYRYWRAEPISQNEKLALCAAAICVATLFYFLVEQPFRRKTSFVGRHAITLALAGAIITIAPATSAWLSGGWVWRYPPALAALIKEPPRATHEGCFLLPTLSLADIPERCYKISDDKKTNVILVGDSTADDLYPGLVEALGDSAEVYSWASSSCPPIVGISVPNLPNCGKANAKFFNEILSENKYDLVIFSCNRCWTQMKSGFGKTIALMDARDVRFVLLGQPMGYQDKPINLVAEYGSLDGLPAFITKHKASSCSDEHGLDTLAPGRFVSMKSAVCKNGSPFVSVDGQMLYVDTLHFSMAGSRYAAKYLAHSLRGRNFLAPPRQTDAKAAP